MAQLTAVPGQPPAVEACVHHWVIESPAGARSRGTCQRCGAWREFANAGGELVWEEERRSAFSSWGRDLGSSHLA